MSRLTSEVVTSKPDELYKRLHHKLTTVSLNARAGKYSRYESANRAVYDAARAHLAALEDNTGDELDAALLRAGAWLAGLR